MLRVLQTVHPRKQSKQSCIGYTITIGCSFPIGSMSMIQKPRRLSNSAFRNFAHLPRESKTFLTMGQMPCRAISGTCRVNSLVRGLLVPAITGS